MMKNRKLIGALALAAALTLSGCGLNRSPKLDDATLDAIKNAVEEAVKDVKSAAEDVKNAAEGAAERVRTGERLDERRYEITDSIDSIDLEWINGKVDVYAAEGDAVVLVERSDDGIYDNEALTWRIEERELKIRWNSGKLLGAALQGGKELALYIPDAAWDELSLDTVSADLTVHDSFRCRELSLDTTSAKISAAGLSADELDISSVSGAVEVSGTFREIDAETVSGDVTIGLTAAPVKAELKAVSGGQTLIVPENCGFTLVFDSVSGKIDSALALTAQNGAYRFGDGAGRIGVETVSGDLTLRGSV